MLIVKLVVLLVVFVVAAGLTQASWRVLVPWWHRRTEGYVTWIVAQHEVMHEPIPVDRAQRLVGLGAFLPMALGLALGSPLLAVLLGMMGLMAPYVWVRYRLHERVSQLDNQLIDALILMGNGLRSGLSLLQALEVAADELKAPIVDEFSRLLKEVRLGRPIDVALVEMAERLKLPDLEIAVHSIVTLRQTGGNLSESFMTVAMTIGERKKVEGKIASLTAQGVYQGIGLCAMPFAFAFMFYLLDPAYMERMFTTGLGWMIWATVILLDVLGMWMILKIVKIEV